MTDDGCCNIHLTTVIDGAGCPQCRAEFSKPFHSEIAELRSDLTTARAEIEQLRRERDKMGSGIHIVAVSALQELLDQAIDERDAARSRVSTLTAALQAVATASEDCAMVNGQASKFVMVHTCCEKANIARTALAGEPPTPASEGGKMSDYAGCSHMVVTYDPIDNGDGTKTMAWHCRDCHKAFRPLSIRKSGWSKAMRDASRRLTVDALARILCPCCAYPDEWNITRDDRNLTMTWWHGKDGHTGAVACKVTAAWEWLREQEQDQQEER